MFSAALQGSAQKRHALKTLVNILNYPAAMGTLIIRNLRGNLVGLTPYYMKTDRIKCQTSRKLHTTAAFSTFVTLLHPLSIQYIHGCRRHLTGMKIFWKEKLTKRHLGNFTGERCRSSHEAAASSFLILRQIAPNQMTKLKLCNWPKETNCPLRSFKNRLDDWRSHR